MWAKATAIALAMERGCGRLKLADFDVVELSNLNRIRCGLHELGIAQMGGGRARHRRI